MDEYLLTVILKGDNNRAEILTYASCHEEAIDNAVQLENVTHLFSIKRCSDSELWEFDAEIKPLRDLRNLINEKLDGGLKIRFSTKEI